MKATYLVFPLFFLFNSCKEKATLSTSSDAKPEVKQEGDAIQLEIEASSEEAGVKSNPEQDSEPSDDEKSATTGKIGLKVLPKEERDPNGLVRIRLRNNHSEAIQSAKVWVIWLDSDDKIVGQKSSWLPTKESELLKSGEERDFMVLVPVTSKPAIAKITFSKLVLEGVGSISAETVLESF